MRITIKANCVFLGAMACVLLVPGLGAAQEGYTYKRHVEDEKPVQLEQQQSLDSGLSVRFMGEEEQGALKLYVKNAASQYDLHDPTADALNQISPAAGIQFKFEF